VLALAGGLQVRGDRRFSERYSGYLAGGGSTDHVKSVEASGFAEAGAGIGWIDEKEGDLQTRLLRTDIGFRGQRDLRFQYYPTPMNIPDVTLAAPRFAVAARYAVNKAVLFAGDAEVMPNVLGDSRVLFNALLKLNAHITEALSFGVSWLLNFDSSPAAGKQNTDSALTVGLEVAL
jgi:hypothetical protein